MRSHGDPSYPDLKTLGNGATSIGIRDPNSTQFEAANTASKSLLPNGGQPVGGGVTLEQMTAALLKMAECMRSHGFPTFPDPSTSGGNFLPAGIDPNSAQFKAAQRICQHYLPNGGPGSAPAGGPAAGGGAP
jgi:hypothetical protein